MHRNGCRLRVIQGVDKFVCRVAVVDIDWGNADVALPAFITMVLMPFTYSIADGIAWGIIIYVAMKAGQGKMNEINTVMGTLCILMIMFYLGPGDDTTFEWLIRDILKL